MLGKSFFVVAIGTSAGGYSILKELFSFLPEKNNAAFIILQHHHREQKSTMQDLMGEFSTMPVYRAEDGQEVCAGCIYVLPENRTMTIKNGHLKLIDREPDMIINRAIDTFFDSMGQDLRHRAIGIILSGNGVDGTEGSHSIHEHGGLVMVQLPSSAEFPGMPESMVENGTSNFTMPVKELALTLAELIRP